MMEVELVLQEVTGETINHGANKARDARLDIHVRSFWERYRSTLFDVRVCHPNVDSYRDVTPKEIYKKHENEKKRQYPDRCPQLVPIGTRTTRHFNKGYVCMYVCMYV